MKNMYSIKSLLRFYAIFFLCLSRSLFFHRLKSFRYDQKGIFYSIFLGFFLSMTACRKDERSAKYHNLFLIIPKGNGWKGQHKDKELLIVNTMKYGSTGTTFEAVGDIGIYTINN